MTDKQIASIIIGVVTIACAWKGEGLVALIGMVAMCTLLGGC